MVEGVAILFVGELVVEGVMSFCASVGGAGLVALLSGA